LIDGFLARRGVVRIRRGGVRAIVGHTLAPSR
jgi:hypothetical protein